MLLQCIILRITICKNNSSPFSNVFCDIAHPLIVIAQKMKRKFSNHNSLFFLQFCLLINTFRLIFFLHLHCVILFIFLATINKYFRKLIVSLIFKSKITRIYYDVDNRLIIKGSRVADFLIISIIVFLFVFFFTFEVSPQNLLLLHKYC